MHLDPVPLGTAPTLDDAAAAPPADAPAKQTLRERLATLGARMAALQGALYAEQRRAMLVVLQARDAGGKDGVIRHVFGRLNPMGVEVTSFKAPTPLELSHDFLWRVHHRVPARGIVGVFNRSHFEDVLVVRVHSLVPEQVWGKRYEQINSFERLLADNGVTVLKFCLHISRQEQRRRLLDRLKEPHKNWKFNAGDLKERERWDAYTEAYQDAIGLTSTEWAPWYVVPADLKPLRDVLVAQVVVAVLERMAPQYPAPGPEAEELRRLLEAGG
ncbi:MAG TPA: PPK2 family polyphosphate kinase [Gemmatimonadales bacterium]|nr:PPK2 family polyphosphate kinase [Gemmatimonadales bacterium]